MSGTFSEMNALMSGTFSEMNALFSEINGFLQEMDKLF